MGADAELRLASDDRLCIAPRVRPSWTRRLLRLAPLALAAACAEPDDSDTRTQALVSVLARADEAIIRSRPTLAAGKFARMRADGFDFVRGSLPVYAHDTRDPAGLLGVSRFASASPLVLSIGDPHPENFGTLVAADGTLGLEPNDFDAAERAPFLWDVRRLAAGLAVAAALANDGDDAARARTRAAAPDIVRSAVRAYAAAIGNAARGGPLERVTGADDPILADVFSRGARDRDARRELSDFTVLEGGRRRLRRGVLDPSDPSNVLVDLPPFALDALPLSLRAWRHTLVGDAPSDAEIEILDAARELGSGVASFPRVRALVLVAGRSEAPEDDVLLEVKELGDPHLELDVPPYVHWDDVKARVVATSRAAWARPDADPRWGVTDWVGLPCQVRSESGGNKTLRVSRMVKERGSAEALGSLARVLGGLVARVHANSDESRSAARALDARINADAESFVEEEVGVATRYAETTLEDFSRFGRALDRLGPRLGVPPDAADAPRPDLAGLFAGVP